MSVSKTYEVQDYHRYDDGTTDKSNTWDYNNVSITNNHQYYTVVNQQGNNTIYFGEINNEDIEFSVDIKFNNCNTGIFISNKGWISDGYSELFYHSKSSNKIYHYHYAPDLKEILNISKSLSSNIWYTFKVKIIDNQFNFSITDNNGILIQTSSVTSSELILRKLYIFMANTGTVYLTNIKIKKL